MFVVGVTGGIGSGKTAASDGFRQLGVTVVDADVVARQVVEPGTQALARIAEHFGAEILQPDGALDRSALRTLIFQDPAAKQWLEACLHPAIRAEIEGQLRQAPGPYSVLVSPLLVETDQRRLCDRLLVVDVPEELQIQRTVIRDNNDAEQVRRIMASQASRSQRLAAADDVIYNTGTREALALQVRELHQRYLGLANSTGAKPSASPPTVACPGCGTATPWSAENPSRPFCSERCRNQDFIGWANETHTIPGDSDFDDLLSGDLPPRA